MKYKKNHSDHISVNKTYRLSKEQMRILSSINIVSQATGMPLDEMACNIVDEDKIRAYGKDFLMKNNSTPRFHLGNKKLNIKSIIVLFKSIFQNKF